MAESMNLNSIIDVTTYFWKEETEGVKLRAEYLLSFALTCRGDNLRYLPSNKQIKAVPYRFGAPSTRRG